MPLEHEKEYESIWITPSSSYIKSENDLTTCINTATTTSISPYIAVSSISPADTWAVCFDPKETKTTIKAEASFTPKEENDIEFIEEYLRREVAIELAKQLLSEDLIKIQSNTEYQVDGSTVYKMKAEVKIIQE